MSGRTVRWLMSLGLAGRTASRSSCRLTIIRHHRVYAREARPLYRLGVSEPVFAAQLDLLDGLGLTPISVAEGLRFLEAGRPGHRVAMSFDDGYADNVSRALPLLAARGGTATFYLTAGWIEERRPAWWDLLAHVLERTREHRLSVELDGVALSLSLETREERARALHALLPRLAVPPLERERRIEALGGWLGIPDQPACELATWDEAMALTRAGMEVGAHTLDHPHLTRLPPDEQRREIAGSMELIERRLSVRPVGLAYPGGDYDATTACAAQATGLAYAVTTRAGVNAPGTPRFELKRRGLSEGACLGPAGRFSRRLARAELEGAFDRWRGIEQASSHEGRAT